MKTVSISPEKGGDGEELNDKEFEQKKGDKVDPLKKRKGSPLKPSSSEEIEGHHDQDVDCPHL
jgi:hypothetical protein